MKARVAGLVSIAFVGLGVDLGAQSVVGTLVERGSGRPVSGAMVRLFGQEGYTGAAYLTGADGRYQLSHDRPGTYHLEVERIGFASARHGPFSLGTEGAVHFDVTVDLAPIQLEGLAVEGEGRRCSLEEAADGSVQMLWDEARKALAAASWTEDHGELGFEVETRVRVLDPERRAVRSDERSTVVGVGSNSVRTAPANELEDLGYVREGREGISYFGPSAEALLSDAFLRTHCFSVRPESDTDPFLIGLEFEPVPGRDMTDIEGVMWVDRETTRLDRVEFAYTGIDDPIGRDDARGQVRFLELPDGRWVIRDWFIQAPVKGVRRTFLARGRDFDQVEVVSIQELGSAVRAIRGNGLDWTAVPSAGHIRGTVFDSTAARPLSGAVVRLADADRTATTDGAGRWELSEVSEGEYRISFEHPRLDSLGFVPPSRPVTVTEGSIARVRFAVPSRTRLLASMCADGPGAVVVGVVLDARGEPAPGVTVSARAGVDPDGTFSVVTDQAGGFALCGLPPTDSFVIAAAMGDTTVESARVALTEGEVRRLDLHLPAGLR